jgi:hypothetical protein
MMGWTPPRDAIRSFFDDILRRSLNDRERMGCIVENSALEMAPHDPESRETIAETLKRIASFFLARVEKGQADGTITSSRPAVGLAQRLLGVLTGVRVLARLRPSARSSMVRSARHSPLSTVHTIHDRLRTPTGAAGRRRMTPIRLRPGHRTRA